MFAYICCMQKILFSIALLVSVSGYSQNYKIGFYNVENLFDTINDPTKDDEEFLPGSANDWNGKRYMEKIGHINKVLGEMGNVLALGMCEIENAHVIRDVIRFSPTMSKTHGVVHFESPDERGIDVGLIYDSIKLKLVASGSIRFTLPGMEKPSSRDILWAKFVAGKKDTVHILVNHWPSRRGGEDQSEPNRLEAAKNARNYIDAVLAINPKAKILFMGDLNDYPTNKAPMLVAEKLQPQILKTSGEFGGSYSYKNEWDVLDHIMVSPGFLGGKKGLRVVPATGKIYSPEYLIEVYKGNKVPFRTYAGKNYLGGYSDHLPVSVEVKLK